MPYTVAMTFLGAAPIVRRIVRAVKDQMAADIARGQVVECDHDATNPCDPCRRESRECIHNIASPCEACQAQAWADEW